MISVNNMRSTRRISRVLLAFAGVLALPVALYAHARLLASDPANGAVLEASPAEIRLVFSERPQLALASVRLVSGTDTTVLAPLSHDAADANTVIAPISAPLAGGAYSAIWQVAARDGHALRGIVSFVVVEAADTASVVAPLPAVDIEIVENTGGSGSVADVVIRWLAFVSFFLLIGAVGFRTFVLRRMGPATSEAFDHMAGSNAASFGMIAAAGLLIASVLKIVRMAASVPDTSPVRMLLESTWGYSVTGSIVAAVGTAVALRMATRKGVNQSHGAWRLALAFALLGGIAPAIGGHAMTGDPVVVSVAADIVHVLAASVWLGTLATIILVGIPIALKTPDTMRPAVRVAGMINTFSPMALLCGGIVVATGLGSSIIHLPNLEALWTTDYGSALFRKVVFVFFLFSTAAWNWRRVKPRLADESMLPKLNRSANLEIVLAAIVLVFTAMLVTLERP